MLDYRPEAMQRARGSARVALGPRGLEVLHQVGCAKAFLPKVHGVPPEVVFLNTAGGLTGGDRLDFELALGAGVSATATTQTAERVYRSTGLPAEVLVRMTADAGAELHWLPQETILYDAACLSRRTEIALTAGATCLTVETLVLGRAAMGETLAQIDLADQRRILRNGMPLVVEPVVIGNAALTDRGSAGLAGHRALATLVFAAAGAEDALGPVRAELTEPIVTAGASAWDGRLIVRAVADDGFPLRRQMARVIARLRQAPLPRVWQI